ncbi:MAG: ABC transporter ATP-binding protein [Lautropia sp.]
MMQTVEGGVHESASGHAHDDPGALLSVRNLRVSIPGDEGVARILDDIDLRIGRGRIVGVVGESGCGKSTLIRSILGILPSNARIERGSISFEGEDLLGLSTREMTRRVRGRAIGFIPQDPFQALNPVFKVGTQLMEILRGRGDDERVDAAARQAQLLELLAAVQLPDPKAALERYPHQFSGGQRQRLLIAGALASRPRLLIADEPTTALDVTTQMQILRLLKRLTAEYRVSMLFVTHDFGVVAQLCDEISVIYAGQSVESGPTAEILGQPRHPYTRRLIECHPDRARDLVGIPGAVPSPLNPPSGCRFRPRCDDAMPGCTRSPAQTDVGGPGHRVGCWLYPAPTPPCADG